MKNTNNHKTIKLILRIVGGVCLITGIVLLLCGTIPFLRGDVRNFNLNFIGIPFAFVGGCCLIFGFMREMNKYVADENTSVVTDVANAVLKGTREEAVKTASAVSGEVACPNCGNVNRSNANYCDECGAVLFKNCPDCGEKNDSNANFCANCGKKL